MKAAAIKEIEKYNSITEEYYVENYQVVRSRVFHNSLMPLVVAAVSSAILVIVGYEDLLNNYNVGGLVSAVLIFALLTSPVSFLGRMMKRPILGMLENAPFCRADTACPM